MNNIYEILGYCGTSILVIAGVPQVVKTIKDNHANGLSLIYLILLILGFLSMLIYILTTSKQIPLVIGYSVNSCSVLILLYYKIFK